MIGMNAKTGTAIGDKDHLAQSIADILTTPVGIRVGRRDYGSKLFDLIDAPFVRGTLLLAYAAIALALAQWEPRVRIRNIVIERADDGSAVVNLEGTRLDRPDPIAPFSTAISLPSLTY